MNSYLINTTTDLETERLILKRNGLYLHKPDKKTVANNGYAPGGKFIAVDKLRMRERFRFQKNISGQKPRPAHSRGTLATI